MLNPFLNESIIHCLGNTLFILMIQHFQEQAEISDIFLRLLSTANIQKSMKLAMSTSLKKNLMISFMFTRGL